MHRTLGLLQRRTLLSRTFAVIEALKKGFVWIVAVALICSCFGLGGAVAYYAAQKRAAVFSLHLDEFRDANAKVKSGTPSNLLVFFGDSRIRQWPNISVFDGYQIANRGISAETTPQMLARFEYDAIDLSPDTIIIQGGINDLVAAAVLPGDSANIVGAAIRNIETMVRKARQVEIPVVLLTIVQPARPPLHRRIVWSDAIIANVENVNDHIRSFDSFPGVVVLDANLILQSGGQYLSSEYSSSTLHWNESAYRKLNSHLALLLKDPSAF